MLKAVECNTYRVPGSYYKEELFTLGLNLVIRLNLNRIHFKREFPYPITRQIENCIG